MKTVKQYDEEIAELGYEAKGIYAAAERANREMTAEEQKRFDEITNKDSGLVVQLKAERAKAIEREEAIRDEAARDRRLKALEEINGDLNSPSRVLPTNGAQATAQATDEPRVFHRMAKLKAFKDDKTAYDAGMWFRAVVARENNRDDKQAEIYCRRKGIELTNAANEGSGPAGGYLVPTPLAQTIIDVRESVGVARRILNIQPMTADTLSIPKRTGGLTVYYPGETLAMTPSDKSWGQVELICKKRGVVHYISQELQEDALISIVDDAVSEMAYALADKEDAECILGDGTSTYGGVRGLLDKIGSAGVFTNTADDHDAWDELDMADFTQTIGLLPEKYSRSPVWVCSANFYWSVMVKVMAEAGGNNIASIATGPQGQPMFMGSPVYFTDKMPRASAASQKCALFGTFSMGGIMGDRTGIRIGRSDDHKFLEDMTALKATSRYDINIHEPGDSQNAGAYVALATNS